MNLLELRKKNLKEAKKAIEYLEILNKDLINLKFETTEGFVTQPNKVSYFDITTEVYKLYDYTEFNSVLCNTYYDVILKQKIEKNKLFNILISNMNIIYENSKYYFHDGILNIFHLVSWFVKSLRYSKVIENKFDVNELLKNFPFPFLVDYINLLREKDVIKTEDLNISFKNSSLLEELLNSSFETPVFGGNLNLDKCIIIPEKIDMSILKDNLII
jgi:ribosomal protein L29